MNKKRTIFLAGMVLMLVLGAFGLQGALAVTPGLYEVAGNPSCGDLYQATVISGPDSDLLDLGPLFGFKYDDNPTGDVSSTLTDNAPWVVTNGPQDPYNSVSISNVVLDGAEGIQFDWSATLGIDAVIVKAQDSNAYVYSPEAFGDTGLTAPDGKAVSHVEFCYDYNLEAEKDAAAEYTRTYTWDITKDFDATYDKFIGDPATSHGYEVSVDQTVTDSDFAVSGSITVHNPTPFAVTFSVSDFVDGVEATVTCDDYALAANDGAPGGADEEVCTYTASLGGAVDGTNTATIASENPDVTGAEATADYAFGEPTTIVGYPDINVSDTNGESWMASGDDSWTYSRDFVCPTDKSLYVDGKYTFTHSNTATIDETGQSDDAAVTVNCYAPVPSKDANTAYTRQFDWSITKDYDGTYDKFIGDPATSHGYEVSVDQTISEYGFAVDGTITVQNPHPTAAMTVSLTDFVDGVEATLDCGGSLNVPAGGSATCDYSADLASKTDGTNTATATLNGIGFDATADYAFGDPTTIVGYPDINVSDTNGESWMASGDDSWTYSRDFVCPTDRSLYVDGKYTFTHTNTATIDETGQSDDATVTVNCYAPVLSKDASASYDERHTWDIEKVVDPISQSGYPGDELSWEWKVTLSESFVEENFAVSGNIDVTNPAGSPGDISVSLADQLSDGTIATVDCDGAGATSVTVAPGATETCSYSASPAGRTATLNTATGTFNSIDFSAQADVNFIANVINGSAVVNDDQEPDFNPDGLTVNAGDGPWTWTETQSHICSTDWADYGAGGTYSATLYNTATVTASDGQTDSADANTTYTCEAGTVDVLKTTDGLIDPTEDWQFALYIGPDGFGGAQVGNTSSTLGDADGILDFGDPIPALRPDTTYTICELDVPAGWATEWSINGTTVIPYNPNADDSPSEDFGNRCFDVGAGTSYPIAVGQNLRITVDNSFPGGAPRTPGYWKNWSSCTGGGQYAKTTDDVDPENEYVSLDEVLNDPGITWDDILADDLVFDITACEDAVSLLDQRDLDTGMKEANDAAFTLAMHLLAAQLNFGAGACTTQEVLDKALAAETLLDEYDFDGVVHGNGKNAGYLTDNKNPDKTYALELADYLDRYNNGEFCGNGSD